MAVSASYKVELSVNEELTLSEDQSSDPTINHQIVGGTATLNATSTPPVTKTWSDDITLTGGAVTLDLTALARTILADENFTGLKVQLIKLVVDSTNTAAVKFDVGATNGYQIFGSATSEGSLGAGDQCVWKFNDTLPDVGASAKTIDVSSSDNDAKFKIIIVAG